MKYLYFIFLLVCYLNSHAQSGLDPTFGNNGMVVVPNNPNSGGPYSGIALQQDDKILVVSGKSGQFAVRYNTDGTSDKIFIKSNRFYYWYSSCIALQPDQKILIGGGISGSGITGDSLFLMRLMPDGSFDNNFGNGGLITLSLGRSRSDKISKIICQADDKILLTGTSGYGRSVLLIRYQSGGSLDTLLNHTGISVTSNGQYGGNIVGSGIMADGRIVVGGLGDTGSNATRCFMSMRFLPDGSLDTTYNHTGKAYTYVTGGLAAYVNAATSQPDGKMVLGGSATDGIIMRYDTTGKLDTSFNHTGIYHYADGNPYALFVQPDSRILAGGTNGDPAVGANTDLYLSRVNSDGTTDSSFGRNGSIATDVHGYTDLILGLATQPDGKILAAGYGKTTQFAGYSDPVIVRYKKDAATAIGNLPVAIQGLSVFPNPAHQSFTISNKTGQPIAQVIITDATGRQLQAIFNPKDTGTISTSTFPSGRYFIQCTLKDGRTAASPLLIQH